MGHIPGPKTLRLYEREWFIELVTSVPTLITATGSAVININDAEPVKYYVGWSVVVSLIFLVIGTTLKILRGRSKDKEQQSKNSYDGLLGALHGVYGHLKAHLGLTDTETDRKRLRVTLHRVISPTRLGSAPDELEQLLPYLGGRGGPAGRRYSTRSGLVGLAVRDQSIIVAQRQNADYEAFLRELVQEWSYTPEEARALTLDRQAWMAVPIPGASGIVAVVYLDSDQRDFFTPELQQLIVLACQGVASYIDARYK